MTPTTPRTRSPRPGSTAPVFDQPGTDHLLVGPARSGTTLVCALLNDRPDVVALDEPYERAVVAATRPDGLADLVTDDLRSQRRSIERSGYATSTVVGGALGNHYEVDAGGRRRRVASIGRIPIELPEQVDRTQLRIVVKHTLLFAAHLDRLTARLPVVGLVRNPLAILLSWNSIDADYRRGRAPAYAESHASDLVRRLDRIDDAVERQIVLLGWHFERLEPLWERGLVVRYEDVVATGGTCLDRLFGPAGRHRAPDPAGRRDRGGSMGAPVDANARATGSARHVERLVGHLAVHRGPMTDRYHLASIEDLAADILGRHHTHTSLPRPGP